MGNKNDEIIYPLKPFNGDLEGLNLVRGERHFLYDDTGKKYIDGISGLWNVSFGYGQEDIVAAAAEQLQRLAYINLYCNSTPIVNQYAKALIQLLEGDFSKLMYTCSGSESIECAIKIARKYHRLKGNPQKNVIAVFDMSYHGTTYAAMSASGLDKTEIHQYAPVVGGFKMIKTPALLENNQVISEAEKVEWINALKTIFENASQIAAIMYEPIIGSAGIIPLPDWYMNALYELALSHDVLVIADEVATGFGRTGRHFAYMHGVNKPDMLCLSKGINNGVVAMGATLINEKIEYVFSSQSQFIEHFSTQNGNPIACAAGYQVIEQLKKPELMTHIEQVGDALKLKLEEKLLPLDGVHAIRGTGLMLGIDLVKKNGLPLEYQSLMGLSKHIANNGLLVYPFICEGQTSGITLMPSYTIGLKDVDKMVNILLKTLMTVL